MADRTKATSGMTLEQFCPPVNDRPPAVLFRKRKMTPGGNRRAVSLTVSVPDPTLYRRLREEVREGEEVRITTETDWDALDRGDAPG